MRLKIVDMTSYEKMIHILHNKDFELLEDWVADDYFFVFESQMRTRDEFLERMKDLFSKSEKASDFMFEEKCLYENEDCMNYTRLERQEDGEIYRVVGMVLKNSEGKIWRSIERITKLEVKK